MEKIYPRSPREVMCGWVHLPRYIDKIRLYLAGKLHSDYLPNLGKGYDGFWLKMAGRTHEEIVRVVASSITDGEVYDWVRINVQKSEAEKQTHREKMFRVPVSPDFKRLFLREREELGLGHREDLKSFVDLIDADEGRI
jgi:Domain of unknown function (DUF5069)